MAHFTAVASVAVWSATNSQLSTGQRSKASIVLSNDVTLVSWPGGVVARASD